MSSLAHRLGATIAVALLLLVPATSLAQEAIDAVIPGCDKLTISPDAPEPAAAAVTEAKGRYERGRQLYVDGAYEQSQLEFERAYELAPAYRILYNIAQVAMLLNDYPKAICAFEGYLSQGSNIEAERKAQVGEELKKLRGRVAYLEIESNVEGARVELDGFQIGQTPILKPIMVNAGRHRVTAKLPGMQSGEDVVTLVGQDRQKVVLELKENVTVPGVITPVPVSGEPAPEPPAAKPSPSYLWVGWVVTGTLTAGAVATGVGALSSTGTLSDMRETVGVTRAELEDQESTARTLGITADILTASAVVAGAVTLYFTITDGDDGEGSLSGKISPTGFDLSGTF